MEVVGIDPRNIIKIPENSKYASLARTRKANSKKIRSKCAFAFLKFSSQIHGGYTDTHMDRMTHITRL